MEKGPRTPAPRAGLPVLRPLEAAVTLLPSLAFFPVPPARLPDLPLTDPVEEAKGHGELIRKFFLAPGREADSDFVGVSAPRCFLPGTHGPPGGTWGTG